MENCGVSDEELWSNWWKIVVYLMKNNCDAKAEDQNIGERKPEHRGRSDPDLLLWAWVILNQEGDHL